jgi:hypothetical protein
MTTKAVRAADLRATAELGEMTAPAADRAQTAADGGVGRPGTDRRVDDAADGGMGQPGTDRRDRREPRRGPPRTDGTRPGLSTDSRRSRDARVIFRLGLAFAR